MNVIVSGSLKAVKGVHFYSIGLLKRLYEWVLHWADTPYGGVALFILAFIEASFFIIPPDVLLMALVIGKPGKWFRFALVCTAGSVIGGLFGYLIGAFFFEAVGNRIIEMLHYQAAFAKVGQLYASNAFLAILGAAFTPIPYKVFTIAAGFWEIPLSPLVWASIVGRGARFFLVAGTICLVGPRVKHYMDKYFNLVTLMIFVLMVLGFLAVKYLF